MAKKIELSGLELFKWNNKKISKDVLLEHVYELAKEVQRLSKLPNEHLARMINYDSKVPNRIDAAVIKAEPAAMAKGVKERASNAAKKGAEKTPQGKAKKEIYELFKKWEPTKKIDGKIYRTDNDFAKYTTAHTKIKNDSTITGWLREWRKVKLS